MIQIITDSAADLPPKIINKYNIHVVPLTVNIDGNEYIDGVDLSPQEFYKKMAAAKNLPKTSQPPVAAFSKMFRNLTSKGELLCINISSKLSGTYQTACLAKGISGVDVTVFDSWAATLGQGLQVIKAARLAEKGLSCTEIINKLTQYRNNMNILILLDTLENIVKGGRLSKFQGTLAKLLNIKVLLTGVLVTNLILGYFTLGFVDQPIAHTDGVWNFMGMALVGLACIFAGGCPLRQLIMSGQGDTDGGVTVLGMVAGAAIAHNFMMASSAAGPTEYGKIAVIIGLIICAGIGWACREA